MSTGTQQRSAAGRTIHQLLEKLAESSPDETALLAGPSTEPLSFAEWYVSSCQVGAALENRNIGPGDRVGVRATLADWAEYVILLHGIYRVGAAAVSLAPHIRDIGPLNFELRTNSSPGEQETASSLIGPAYGIDRPDAAAVIDEELLADVVHTSGATGTPKPVEISHRAALWNFNASEVVREDRSSMFSIAPPGSNAALELSRVPLGGAMLVVPPSTDPKSWRDVLKNVAIRNLSLVPAQARMLVQVAPDLVLPDVRVYVSNSDALSAPMYWQLTRLVPNATIYNSFATTEGGAIGAFWTQFDPEQPGRVGQAESGFVPRIEGPDGVELERGRVGRILLPNFEQMGRRAIAEGPIETEGWMTTGDIGYLDTDGSLVIVDRDRQVAKVAGTRVSTRAIEHQLMGLAGVRNAAVFAMPHRTLGQKLHAAVVTDRNEASLMAAINDAVPLWAPAMQVQKVETLPFLPSGKIDRLELERRTAGSVDAGRSPTDGPRLVADLADLFSAKLGVVDISADTDFFEAGGDSLAALEIIETLSETIGVGFEALDFWDYPTPRALAAAATREVTSS